MNTEDRENDLLGAIEEVAPGEDNMVYDEDDDGIEIESDIQNYAESSFNFL